MAAFFGDVHVAPLVDAEEVRDRFARRDGAEEGAVARAEDLDVRVRDEERAAAEDRLETPRNVRLEDAPEDVAVADRARGRFDGDDLARGRVADEQIIEGDPRCADRGDGTGGGRARRGPT